MRLVLPLFLAFGIIGSTYSQGPIERFGKSRLQYKKFEWKFYSSSNFDVHFNQGGEEYAKLAIEYLEEEFDRITDLLGYSPYAKTKIYVYNSVSDLQQSNVGLRDKTFDIGGQTNFLKLFVEIGYPGTISEFKSNLIYEVTRLYVNDMLFGGTLAEMFQSSYLLSLPEWFIDGVARYVAYGWDIEVDDYVRDVVRTTPEKRLFKLKVKDNGLIGQSIWNYVAEKYGKSNISNILNFTRIVRNEERSLSSTLGVPYKQFLLDWQNFYLKQVKEVEKTYQFVDPSTKIRKKNNREFIFNHIKISPNGRFLAYSENRIGEFEVKIKDLQKNKTRTVLRQGFKRRDQEVDYDLPLLSWKNDSVLAIVGTKAGRNTLYLYGTYNKRKVSRDLGRFTKIQSITMSQTSNLAVVSATTDERNDLYLISLTRNSIKRLTNDIYDDIDPAFMPNAPVVIFSSNRPFEDSTDFENPKLSDIKSSYNLYTINLTGKRELRRVTNTLANDVKPVAVSDSKFYFLSDQKGVINLYQYNQLDSLYNQVSNFGVSIEEFDVNINSPGLAFSMRDKDRDFIFYIKDYNLDNSIFTQQTLRQEQINAKFIADRIAERRRLAEQQKSREVVIVEQPDTIPPLRASDSILVIDSAAIALDSLVLDSASITPLDSIVEPLQPADSLVLAPADTVVEELSAESAEEVIAQVEEEKKDDLIDTENYVFDPESLRNENKVASFLAKYRQLQKNKRVRGPLEQDQSFTWSNIVTSFLVDPLFGFALQLETQMNDLLENHRFNGGLTFTTDFRSGRVFGEYQYLQGIIDYRAAYNRETISDFGTFVSQRQTLDRFELGASLPFTNAARIAINPFYQVSRFIDSSPAVIIPGAVNVRDRVVRNQYVGIKSELVYDNTRVLGFNIIEGTRAKVSYAFNRGIGDQSINFNDLRVDVRHYQKIFRELIFATRLFYGRFGGNDPQRFLVGGIENWLFFDFNEQNTLGIGENVADVDNDEFVDLNQVEFVSALRGFDFNAINGTNALTFNAEVRLPLAKVLYRGPITSNFLRNLQFVGFYDIGTAWTDVSPFGNINEVSTEVIESGAFVVTLNNFSNPFLQSYGGGLRTVFLGYFIRFETSFPIQDGIQSGPRFQVGLGFDF